MATKTIAAAILIALTATLAIARDDGRYAESPFRDWFLAQTVPNGPHKGTSCCSAADGVTAEEDIRGSEYWVRFRACDFTDPTKCTQVDWMRVDPNVVLDGPNKRGVAVVWWYFDGSIKVRCFAPGSRV